MARSYYGGGAVSSQGFFDLEELESQSGEVPVEESGVHYIVVETHQEALQSNGVAQHAASTSLGYPSAEASVQSSPGVSARSASTTPAVAAPASCTGAGAADGVHSNGMSFYKYGPPGTPHSDFVRIVSSNLPYRVRPQRPSRTIQDWLVGCDSVGQVLRIVEGHGYEFDCINTATAMHRLARWFRESPDRRLFGDPRWELALTQVRRNLTAFQSRHLSGTLWALATLAYRGPELGAAITAAEEHLREFTPTDLALTAWSIATLREEPRGLYEEISRLAVPMIAEFQPQSLSNICWATATLRKENDLLVRNAAFVAVRLLDAGVSFRPYECSTLVWSMVLTQAREEQLFNRISDVVVRRVSEFGPQELTNTVWAFASLGVRTEGLFETVADACLASISRFNTQNITNVAWAYTHLTIDSPALLKEVARVALSRIPEMNVQDLAQLALSLLFIRGHDASVESRPPVFGSREMTLQLVRAVTVAMVEKLRRQTLTYPDDAWIIHDLVMVWIGESSAAEAIGAHWVALDGYVCDLYEKVADFLLHTPLLRYAQPCGAVVQTVHMQEYERAFRSLDLRSLGIKFTSRLLSSFGLVDDDLSFVRAARAQLETDHAELLAQNPGAGSQNWCLFRFRAEAIVQGATAVAQEEGIRVRSCGGDPVAITLLDAPFEAHLIAVKLSNDRLNHRRRDAEFRAMAHTAGAMRALLPDADALMADRIWWGKSVRGQLQIYITEVPCLSCLGAMVQFSKRFPNMKLRVSFPGIDESCPR